MQIKFFKYQGCGNDFIILDATQKDWEPVADIKTLGKKVCHRNFGVGADGLLLIEKSKKADIKLKIVNSDGSVPEMCGNGIRCVAKYMHEYKKTNKPSLEIETDAGLRTVDMLVKNGVLEGLRVDMGEPIVISSLIPIISPSSQTFIRKEFRVDDRVFFFTAISMGNPHAITFIDSLDFNFEKYGAMMEFNELFPQRTNVEFVKVHAPDRVEVKVWERGAGPTLACGTGACAVVVAGNLEGKLARFVRVTLPGGTLEIDWREDNHVFMTGPAEKVFEGEVNLAML